MTLYSPLTVRARSPLHAEIIKFLTDKYGFPEIKSLFETNIQPSEARGIANNRIVGSMHLFAIGAGLPVKCSAEFDFYSLMLRYVKDLDFRAKVNVLMSQAPKPDVDGP